MAVEVVMPRLGWTMETGVVAEWLKRDGDAVQPGEVIFTVESDKAVHEVEALDGGTLRIPPDAPAVGTAVPVGTVLAYLLAPDEAGVPMSTSVAATPEGDAPGVDPEPGLDLPAQPALNSSVQAPLDLPAQPAVSGNGRRAAVAGVVASPRARRVAGELGVDWTAATGTGRSGRIVERDVRALAEQAHRAERARVTPLARRLAEDRGVDLAALQAGRPGQRIARADVAAARRAGDAEAEASENAALIAVDGRRTPLSQIRRVTAERMAWSARTAAPVTLTTEADATELVVVRTRIKAALAGSDLRVPSYTDLLARLVALTLLQQPWMNSSLVDDAIVRHEAVHVGIAVDTERGLIVPVVRDAHRKSVQQIAEDSARLIALARAGRAGGDDLRGGTFTITNLGMYEIDAFTPIINLPECAILGVGRIVARPVVVDEDTEETAVRKMMAVSLTFDHRVVDGAPAARFLQQVKHWIEQPYAWLTR